MMQPSLHALVFFCFSLWATTVTSNLQYQVSTPVTWLEKLPQVDWKILDLISPGVIVSVSFNDHLKDISYILTWPMLLLIMGSATIAILLIASIACMLSFSRVLSRYYRKFDVVTIGVCLIALAILLALITCTSFLSTKNFYQHANNLPSTASSYLQPFMDSCRRVTVLLPELGDIENRVGVPRAELDLLCSKDWNIPSKVTDYYQPTMQRVINLLLVFCLAPFLLILPLITYPMLKTKWLNSLLIGITLLIFAMSIVVAIFNVTSFLLVGEECRLGISKPVLAYVNGMQETGNHPGRLVDYARFYLLGDSSNDLPLKPLNSQMIIDDMVETLGTHQTSEEINNNTKLIQEIVDLNINLILTNSTHSSSVFSQFATSVCLDIASVGSLMVISNLSVAVLLFALTVVIIFSRKRFQISSFSDYMLASKLSDVEMSEIPYSEEEKYGKSHYGLFPVLVMSFFVMVIAIACICSVSVFYSRGGEAIIHSEFVNKPLSVT